MRGLLTLLIVVSMTAVASAQAQPYPQPQPQPQPYPQPQPQPYPQPQPQQYPGPYGQPYGYGQQRPVMQYQLTVDEQFLLERGFISDGEWIGGGLVNLFFGFGIGQAVQGRWSDRGWIFTLGEGAGLVVMVYGMTRWLNDCFESDVSCNDNNNGVGLFLGGMLAYGVFHIWSIVDAFAVPPAHNRRLRDLQLRLGMRPTYARVIPYVTSPKGDAGGAVAGITLRF